MNIWITGDWNHVDFAEIVAELGSQATFCAWDKIPEEMAPPPDLIVLAQARRHQFSPIDAQRLRARWPATPCVHLLSSWCEGEIRSGIPLEGWVRVYWHRWHNEFARFARERSAARTTPWENGPQNAFDGSKWLGGPCLSVGLWSRCRSETLMIRDCLQWFGHTVDWFGSSAASPEKRGQVQASVVVGDSLNGWFRESLLAARRACRRGVKIAILGFPRHQEVDELRRLGGKNLRVISKPFDVGLLQQALQSQNSSGFAASSI